MRTVPIAIAMAALAAAPAVAQGPPIGPPTPARAWAGRVLAPVSARTAPSPAAPAITVLRPIAALGNGPTVVAVTAIRTIAGERWVRVLLPVRPNGRQGWLRADALRFHTTPLRMVVDQSDRRLTLYRGGRVLLRARVAVGEPGTPTPNGRFAVAEMIRTRTRGAFLGPIVFPLTGYSERLNEYAGGNGRVAVHGTSLPQLLGTRASHGCVRVGNRDIVRISRLVRPGTPVVIRA